MFVTGGQSILKSLVNIGRELARRPDGFETLNVCRLVLLFLHVPGQQLDHTDHGLVQVRGVWYQIFGGPSRLLLGKIFWTDRMERTSRHHQVSSQESSTSSQPRQNPVVLQ